LPDKVRVAVAIYTAIGLLMVASSILFFYAMLTGSISGIEGVAFYAVSAFLLLVFFLGLHWSLVGFMSMR